jgi:hypothetical protein
MELFLKKMTLGTIAGVEPSTEAVARGAVHNAEAIKRLPSDDNAFDETLAINSMQVLLKCSA